MTKTTITYRTIYSYDGGYFDTVAWFDTREEQIKFENEYKNNIDDTNKGCISYIVITTKSLFSKPQTIVEEISEWWED